jgi:hypothetical protein
MGEKLPKGALTLGELIKMIVDMEDEACCNDFNMAEPLYYRDEGGNLHPITGIASGRIPANELTPWQFDRDVTKYHVLTDSGANDTALPEEKRVSFKAKCDEHTAKLLASGTVPRVDIIEKARVDYLYGDGYFG